MTAPSMPDARRDRHPGSRVRSVALVLAGLGAGFAIGRWSCGAPAPSTAPVRATKPPPDGPRLLPRRSLTEQNTIVVGGVSDDDETEDADGHVLLRASDEPRVLLYEADDADAARTAVERFVGALRPNLVRMRAPAEVEFDDVRLLWRIEGEGADRRLRVVAVPIDPYRFDGPASRLVGALGEWTIVQGLYPTTAWRFAERTAAVTSVRTPRVPLKTTVFEAAEEEFRRRGLTLSTEDVAQGMVVELARDTGGRLLWSFSWCEDQAQGTYAVHHVADPFDTAGEQELLLAVFARALGREVRIQLDPFR